MSQKVTTGVRPTLRIADKTRFRNGTERQYYFYGYCKRVFKTAFRGKKEVR